MTYLWGGMLLVGVLYGTMTGNTVQMTNAILTSSREAIDLCIMMAGITAMWTGFLKIAERSGIVDKLSEKMRPALGLLFPELKKEREAMGYISMNFLSNMLGLGWASTASGLLAFREMDRINREKCAKFGENEKRAKDLASKEMCTFLIINVSSLQLLPMTLLTYRAKYGSVNPAAIAGPYLITTTCSTTIALLFCLWMNRREK